MRRAIRAGSSAAALARRPNNPRARDCAARGSAIGEAFAHASTVGSYDRVEQILEGRPLLEYRLTTGSGFATVPGADESHGRRQVGGELELSDQRAGTVGTVNDD